MAHVSQSILSHQRERGGEDDVPPPQHGSRGQAGSGLLDFEGKEIHLGCRCTPENEDFKKMTNVNERCLESVPIRVDGGGARLVAVTVDCHLVDCFFFFVVDCFYSDIF